MTIHDLKPGDDVVVYCGVYPVAATVASVTATHIFCRTEEWHRGFCFWRDTGRGRGEDKCYTVSIMTPGVRDEIADRKEHDRLFAKLGDLIEPLHKLMRLTTVELRRIVEAFPQPEERIR